MVPVLAKAAINLIAANALLSKFKSFRITLHGGGEPTRNWPVFKESVLYARRLGRELNLDVYVSCATNGVISNAKMSWIIKNTDSCSLSLDGLRDDQNRQRPIKGGKGSFDQVMSTLNALEKSGHQYNIRATATRESLSNLPEFLTFLIAHARHAKSLQIEPLFPVGRALESGAVAPDPEDFATHFQALARQGDRSGLPVHYAACDINIIKDYFCGAFTQNFVVTPTGEITTCYEVSEPDDPRWSVFNIGRYNTKQQKFEFYKDKIENLWQLGKDMLSQCDSCIARYNCAGDCPAKRLLQKDNQSAESRCKLIKAITLDRILWNIERLSGVAVQVDSIVPIGYS